MSKEVQCKSGNGNSTLSGRIKKAEEYHKWRKSQDGFEIKDCFESAYVFIETTELRKKDQQISKLEKELEEYNKIKKQDYIHNGENLTGRDFYFYTNGLQQSLDDINQLKKELAECKELKEKQDKN